MALWQYDMHVIPRSGLSGWLSQPDAPMPTAIDEESMERVAWWEGARPGNLKQLFSSLLPARDNWDPECPSWGSEDGHRIDLIMNGPNIGDLFVRIDVRSLSDGFLSRLLTVLTELDWLLVTPRRRIIEPWPEDLWRELQDSPARQFVDDPEAFLRDMHDRTSRKRGSSRLTH